MKTKTSWVAFDHQLVKKTELVPYKTKLRVYDEGAEYGGLLYESVTYIGHDPDKVYFKDTIGGYIDNMDSKGIEVEVIQTEEWLPIVPATKLVPNETQILTAAGSVGVYIGTDDQYGYLYWKSVKNGGIHGHYPSDLKVLSFR